MEKEHILPKRRFPCGSSKGPIIEREHPEIISLYSIVTVQEEGYPSSEIFQIIPASKKGKGDCKNCDYYVSDLDPVALACMGKHENDTARVDIIPLEEKEKEKSIAEVNTKSPKKDYPYYIVTILNVNNDMQEECLNRS